MTFSHHPSLCTRHVHRADECKSLLVGLFWFVHIWEPIGGRMFLLQYPACIVRLSWFVKWAVSGCTVTILSRVDSRMYSKQPVASLFSSYLAFLFDIVSCLFFLLHDHFLSLDPLTFSVRNLSRLWIIYIQEFGIFESEKQQLSPPLSLN